MFSKTYNSSKKNLHLAFIASLFLFVGIIFWKVHILDAPPRTVGAFTVDLFQQFMPWNTYMASSLLSLRLPLWFPFAGAGIPFLATPSTAVFYFPNLLYLLLPVPAAMGVLAVLHLAIAGGGTYAFCRRYSIAKLPSIFAGCSFMLSNAVWNNYVNPHYLAGVAWLPVVFLLAEELYIRPSLLRSLLLSITIAIQFLTGAGQFFLYTLYFLFLYLTLKIVFDVACGKRELKKQIPFAAFFTSGIALGIILSAIQLLPSLELLRDSIRSEPLTREMVHFPEWYFQWWWPLLNLLYSHWTRIFEGLFHQGGLLQVLFLFCCFINYRNWRLYIFLILFAVSIALSTGYMTPLYKYFALLPGIGQSRQPNRIAVITAFSLSFLSAIGLDNCMKLIEEQVRMKRVGTLAITTGLFGLMLWVVRTRGNLIFLIAGLSLLFVALALKNRWMMRISVATVICLSAWESGRQHTPATVHPEVLHDYLSPSDIQMLERLKMVAGDERVFIEERHVPPLPFSVYRAANNGVYSITDYHPAISSRMEDIIEAITGSKPFYPDGRIPLTSETARPELLNLFSVKYLLLHKKNNILDGAPPRSPMAKFREGLRVAEDFAGYILYENTRALPRTYLAHAAIKVSDPTQALQQILSEYFPLRSGVVLEGEAAPNLSLLPSAPNTSDVAEITQLSPRTVFVHVKSDMRGMLVLTDSYYPGWKAQVDGKPVPIYRANYLFRAVPVPEGSHQVIFSYRPFTFLAGMAISGLGFVLLGLCLFFALRRHPASSPGEEAITSSPTAPAVTSIQST